MKNVSLTASDNLKFRFATDGEGNYGYLGADDSFIPFSGGKLLWTNPKPRSTFNAQSITIPENSYTHYIVIAKASLSDTNRQECWGIAEKNDTTRPYGLGNTFIATDGTAHGVSRRILNTGDNYIQFADGYYDGSLSNNYVIPTTVYGINLKIGS